MQGESHTKLSLVPGGHPSGTNGKREEPLVIPLKRTVSVARPELCATRAGRILREEGRELIIPRLECEGPHSIDLARIALHYTPMQNSGRAKCLDVFIELLDAGIISRCLSLDDFAAMAKNVALIPPKLRMGEILLWKSASRVQYKTTEGCIIYKMVPFMDATGQSASFGWHLFDHDCGDDRPAGLLPVE